MAIIIADPTNIFFRLASEDLNKSVSFKMSVNYAQQGSGSFVILDADMEETSQKDSWTRETENNLGTAQSFLNKTMKVHGVLSDINPQTNRLGAEIAIKVGNNTKTFAIPKKMVSTTEKDTLIITAFVFFLPA